MQVNAVLFDLGGTLIKTSEIPHVMKKILKEHGIERSIKEISQARIAAEKELDFRDLARLLDEFWVQWNVRILNNLQAKTKIEKLARFIATHWWDYSHVILYPDAEDILLLLKEKNVKMGVITNGLQSDVDQILPKIGLQNFFDIVVVIDTLKKMKPEKEVFHYALQELKTQLTHVIYIGDEIEADYKGARNAGLTTYLIDRESKVNEEGVNTISSLHDLCKLKIVE